MKYLHFQENIRPPFYGTHRRKSTKVYSRSPFGQDPSIDYDEDSGTFISPSLTIYLCAILLGDDWEEEPEDGEQLDKDEKVSGFGWK